MKNVVEKLRNYPIYLGIFLLIFSFAACSDDDDGIIEPDPMGFFEVGEEFTLNGNTIVLESITVEQKSWLVAVPMGEEDSRNFISDPVMLEEGVNTNVELTLDEGVITDPTTGEQIVLKLYADHPTMGTQDVFDENDMAITDENNVLVTEIITVFAENTMAFSNFDENSDGMLSASEVPAIYQDNFAEWDTNDDGSLDEDEFFTTTFGITDGDDDDGVDQEEWNLGFESTFGSFIEDDFATFDGDGDGVLDSDEWNTAFADSDWFGVFDNNDDSMIAEDEWDAGLFSEWDTNDDNSIDEDEFNVFSPFVSTW